jgi:GTP-binding protein
MKLMTQVGLEKIGVDSAACGQIVAISGSKKGTVNSTLCNAAVTDIVPHIPIDPPTVCMSLGPNDGPLVGKEGNGATSAMIREFMAREVETNVSLKLTYEKPAGKHQEACQVYGRGELQLGILLENMRRAGFELCVGAPSVVMKEGKNKEILEPVEELVLECATEFQGCVIDKLAERKAEMKDLINLGRRVKMVWHVTTRGLIGYRQEFMSDTEGSGVFNHLFHSYIPFVGDIERTQDKKGALISLADGVTTAYAIEALQARGSFYVGAGVPVYAGMVVGLSSKAGDVEINPVKLKTLTNVRSTSKQDAVILTPPVIRTLETMIAEVRDDEFIEITTKSLRIRKKELDAAERSKTKMSKRQRIKLLSAIAD